MIGRDANGHHGEHDGAHDPRQTHRRQLLHLHREVDGDEALDGEGEDEAGREVGEQVGEVLQQLAHQRATVLDVDGAFAEVHAAQRREDLGEHDADQVERVGRGERQQVDARRDLTHVLRREDEHVEQVRHQTHRDEHHRPEEEHLP